MNGESITRISVGEPVAGNTLSSLRNRINGQNQLTVAGMQLLVLRQPASRLGVGRAVGATMTDIDPNAHTRLDFDPIDTDTDGAG